MESKRAPLMRSSTTSFEEYQKKNQQHKRTSSANSKNSNKQINQRSKSNTQVNEPELSQRDPEYQLEQTVVANHAALAHQNAVEIIQPPEQPQIIQIEQQRQQLPSLEILQLQMMLTSQMQQMQQMFETKLKSMKQKNKKMLAKAIEEHIGNKIDSSIEQSQSSQPQTLNQQQKNQQYTTPPRAPIVKQQPALSDTMDTIKHQEAFITQPAEQTVKPQLQQQLNAQLEQKDAQINLLINEVRKLQDQVISLKQTIELRPPLTVSASQPQLNPRPTRFIRTLKPKVPKVTDTEPPNLKVGPLDEQLTPSSKKTVQYANFTAAEEAKQSEHHLLTLNQTSGSRRTSQLSVRRERTMVNVIQHPTKPSVEDSFAEKFIKVSFRDYSNNTRMDIKNVDLKSQQIKRDRMLNYWQNHVVENFLPPLNPKRKLEMEQKKIETLTVKRARISSAQKPQTAQIGSEQVSKEKLRTVPVQEQIKQMYSSENGDTHQKLQLITWPELGVDL